MNVHTYYPRIKVNGKRVAMHRHVMEQAIGRPLEQGEFVHHVNEDKRDYRIDNLALISNADHIRLHRTGKVTSAETKKRISEAKTGTKQTTLRKLSDDQAREILALRASGLSADKIASMYGVATRTVRNLVDRVTYKDIQR